VFDANGVDGALQFTTDSSSGKYTIEDDGTIVYTINTAKLGAAVNAVRICAGMDENTIITLNEEIKEGGGTEIVEEYAWANTGLAFVPADYEDRIVAVEAMAQANKKALEDLENVMFIAPDGDDANSGLTASSPKKTIKACVDVGATKISAKRGVYKEVISLSNIDELEIFPTDNNLSYAVGEERELIVFDSADRIDVSSLIDHNSIKKVAYSNSENT
jgi:hypothetical protein